jgi:hypothetical protein
MKLGRKSSGAGFVAQRRTREQTSSTTCREVAFWAMGRAPLQALPHLSKPSAFSLETEVRNSWFLLAEGRALQRGLRSNQVRTAFLAARVWRRYRRPRARPRNRGVHVPIGCCSAGDIPVQTGASMSRNRLLRKIRLRGRLCWITGLGVCRLSR